MNLKTHLRPLAVGSTAVALALSGAVAAQASSGAGAPSASPAPIAASVPASGVPTATGLTAGLGLENGTEQNYFDSIYLAATVHSGGQTFGVLVQMLRLPAEHAYVRAVAIVNERTGWDRYIHDVIPAAKVRWSTDELDLTTNGLSWTGNAQHQHLLASTPWGSLNLRLSAQGPAMYYGGTGSFLLLGHQQTEFALPQMRTTGDMTVMGHSRPVTGTAWLDRQWGGLPNTGTYAWTWMNLSMPNGDKVAIWNPRSASTQQSWATILHPDGTQEVVPVTPLYRGADRRWTSPATGSTYPTQWRITIPTRHTRLTVRVTSKDQELVAPVDTVYEGAATFTGTYDSHPVSGRTYVEMAGNWKG